MSGEERPKNVIARSAATKQKKKKAGFRLKCNREEL